MDGVRLPKLRSDLRLLKASADQDGAPRWAIHDVSRNQFFNISSAGFQLIKHWQPGLLVDEFLARLATQSRHYEPEDFEAFLTFLTQNNLIQAQPLLDAKRLREQREKRQKVWWQWLVHNYLFIRIPLLRPDAWLGRMLPSVQWLISPVTHYLILALGVLGLLGMLRHWDVFWATFMHFFSWQGLVFYGLALIAVKILHELGHAFATKYYGCKVGSMGIAFLVMFPVLYTDTTDAWRLTTKYQRLQIVLAGMRIEFYLAFIATFLWVVLPEGSAKSAAFFVATVSWVSSLLVNATPFLRFDGYYAMSDALGMANLQERGFAVGRWYLRKHLLGWVAPLPEPLGPNRVALLITYAWLTWLYRFILFIGIALLVYHLFFKVLGIVLFIVEIVWFILLPIVRELTVWVKNREQFGVNKRNVIVLSFLVALLIWALWPQERFIHAPAILKAQSYQTIYAPIEAELTSLNVREGDWVEAGQVIATLHSPSLALQLEQTAVQIALLEHRIDRIAGSLDDRNQLHDLYQSRQRLEHQLAGLSAQQAKLILIAEVSGRVVQLLRVNEGQSVVTERPFAAILGDGAYQVTAFVRERDVAYLRAESSGRFFPNYAGGKPLPLLTGSVAEAAVESVPYLELVSDYGGAIAARSTGSGHYIAETAVYPVYFLLAEPYAYASESWVQRAPGVVTMTGEKRSWLGQQARWVWAVLIRESGF